MTAEPGSTGDRFYFTNHSGVVWYSTRPFAVTDEEQCQAPAGVIPGHVPRFK